jgi:RNA polymerase sigma-70 factor (ECF subfamily)
VSPPLRPSWQGLTDEQLVGICRQGGKEAFGELVRRHRRLLVGIAYRMSGDAMLAEDAAQDACIRAWRRLPSFQPRGAGSFRAWLCRIATNVAIDRLRRSRPTVPLQDLDLTGSVRPDDAYLRKEKAEAVQSAILRLPEASRAALILREYEGLSYREISEALGIPVGTVMSRLHYARGRLQKELADQAPVRRKQT